ncbi:MAG: adenylate/guanylate cyclase domain-containing protein [Anaerolineae bacterium]
MPDARMNREVANEIWYWYLNGEARQGMPKALTRNLEVLQRRFDFLPGSPRCIQCHVPLAGLGSAVVKPFGFQKSALTPRLCNRCETLILSAEGGVELELSLLFADIRGSTVRSEQQGALEYRDFIQRFYKAASNALIERFALVNRLVGDQAIGLFVPRFAGRDHAAVAIAAAEDILRATGHGDPEGPWAPVGVGVHTGTAYVGAVGSRDSVKEIAVLGQAANLAARLSSSAAEGEILVSPEAAAAAHLAGHAFEQRSLTLKGISKPVTATVMTLTGAR